MDSLEQNVLAAIDMDGLLSFLSELIAIPSVTGEEKEAQESVAAHMRTLGLEVDVWQMDLAALRQHPFYSAEVERTEALGVVGALGGGPGPTLIFNGHVDVVPIGQPSLWSYPPWRATLAGGRVYGRGAVDMKGGLCCALYAAKALRDANVPLAGRLLIQSVVGEEDGGVGTLGTILRGYRADGAIVLEPTELIVAPAQAGALNYRITIPGKVAHGAMRTEGVSAVDKFLLIYQALRAFEQSRTRRFQDPLFADYELPYPITVGILEAGEWASNVPDRLVCAGRYGVAVGEDVAAARQAFEEMVRLTAAGDPWLRDHPPIVEWWGGQFQPAAIPADHPLTTTLSRAFTDVSGAPATVRGMPYGADMRLLINQGGTPTVLFGPGDVRVAHRPDEFIAVDDLHTATKTLALTALRFCGLGGDLAEAADGAQPAGQPALAGLDFTDLEEE
ncbi:MAG: ArgE/DapE family deacylase [Candidatus Promineifilaceae bacterium]|nr:ArgE/DapE family deacylase [Candidatus Promineifilaceae bacterium]